MAPWLSDAWVAEAVRLGESAVVLPGLDTTLAVVVTGGPQREVTTNWVIADGRVVFGSVVFGSVVLGSRGQGEGAMITLTLADADARSILEGTLDPSVAFMRGRLKTAGDPGQVLVLLAATATEDFAAWRAAVQASTDPAAVSPPVGSSK